MTNSISPDIVENLLRADTGDLQLFYFDPNTASHDTLVKLGLSTREANTLIKYRSNGGKFREASDINKIYGLASVKAVNLIPFVRIHYKKSAAVSRTVQSAKPLIEINSCDTAALVTLPGIGPVLSLRIIKYRNLLGGFASVDQLKEVYGLSAETFNLIKVRVVADTALITGININSAEYKELTRFPYFEKYEVTAILKYKKLKGRIENINDLIDNKLIPAEKGSKVKPYLNFE